MTKVVDGLVTPHAGRDCQGMRVSVSRFAALVVYLLSGNHEDLADREDQNVS